MTFHMEAGRIYSTSGSGFDTDERLLTPASPNPFVGSYTTGTYSWNTAGDGIINTLLFNVPAEANSVQGSVQITVSGTTRGITNKGFFDASGTIMIAMRETWPALSSSDFSTQGIGCMVMFTFYCDSGGLYLREHYRISPPQNLNGVGVVTLNPHTLNYYLYPMAFV